MAAHPRGMRRAAVALVLLLLAQSVAAAPSPGDPEVANDICSTWQTADGICDDYDSTLDLTPSDSWVEGRVAMVMESASTIEMTIELAVRELPREDLGLLDLDLEGDSNPADGIPADYIRNYRDLVRDGSSVEDAMLEEVEEIILAIVEENFPDSTIGPVQTTSEISFFSRADAQCTYDPNIDSIDEEDGRANDPFNPPICLRSTLELNINPANIGMNPETGDVDRMMEGLMMMGGEVQSNFSTIATAGQYLEYTMIPPDFASVSQVTLPGERFRLGLQTWGSRIAVDNLAGSAQAPPLTLDLATTLDDGRGAPSHSAPELRLELVVDARDRMNSRIDLVIAIHHLSAETIADWGLELETSTIDLDMVTADGIRMFDAELDSDVAALVRELPIDDLSGTFAEALGVELMFQPPSFAPANDEGGLMFQHRPGETCDENLAYRYCLDGLGWNNSGMSGAHPIVLQTTSMPSQMQVSSIVARLLQHAEGDISTLDLSILTDEDLAAMMSVLQMDLEFDVSYLQDLLPADFPSADISMIVHLPEWLDSTHSDPDSLVFMAPHEGGSTHSVGIAGSRPFDWQHAICLESGRGIAGAASECTDSSEDLICGSNQKTCVSLDVEVEIERLALRETRAAVEFEFSAEVTLELYRLGLKLDEENIEVSPIPSDLIRRLVAVGDRRDGGLLGGSEQKATIPLTSGDYDMEISNEGLQALAEKLIDEVEAGFDEIEQIGAQDIIIGSRTYSSDLDIEAVPFTLDIEHQNMPLNMEASDSEPVKVSISIDSASLTIALIGDEVRVNLAPATIQANPLAGALADLGLVFSDYGISAEGAIFHSIVPPIMEHTTWGTIRSSARLSITMPDSIRLTMFESDQGLGEIREQDGKQVLVYRTPVCPTADSWSQCYREHDTIRWSAEVSYGLIIGEAIPYIFVLAVFLGLAVSRWKRHRDRRKAASKDAEQAIEEQLLEMEFAAQMGELDEKIVIEKPASDAKGEGDSWWSDQSDLV